MSRQFVRSLVLFLAVTASAGVLAQTPAPPPAIEGRLIAASCLVSGDSRPTCSLQAFQRGAPAGVLGRDHYVMLLLDSRTLTSACLQDSGSVVRVKGLVSAGVAVTPLAIEQRCGGAWRSLPLPYSGVQAPGAGGGDE